MTDHDDYHGPSGAFWACAAIFAVYALAAALAGACLWMTREPSAPQNRPASELERPAGLEGGAP